MKKGYLKKIECCPPGRKGKERPRNSLMQKVTTGMRENAMNIEWIDREDYDGIFEQ